MGDSVDTLSRAAGSASSLPVSSRRKTNALEAQTSKALI